MLEASHFPILFQTILSLIEGMIYLPICSVFIYAQIMMNRLMIPFMNNIGLVVPGDLASNYESVVTQSLDAFKKILVDPESQTLYIPRLLALLVTMFILMAITVVIFIVLQAVLLYLIDVVFFSRWKRLAFSYKCKHVMVTGGSSGIGLELAKEYIRRGANVTIVARNITRLREAKAELDALSSSLSTTSPSQVNVISCDTSQGYAKVVEAFQPAIAKYGDVDVLVNCAGISISGEFDQLPAEQFEKMLQVNVLGSVYPTKVVVSGMKKKKAGRIIFVSSQVAQVHSLTYIHKTHVLTYIAHPFT